MVYPHEIDTPIFVINLFLQIESGGLENHDFYYLLVCGATKYNNVNKYTVIDNYSNNSNIQ